MQSIRRILLAAAAFMFVFSAIPAFGASYLGTVDFSDANHGYLGGWYGSNPRSGFMSTTNDGGATWHAILTGESSPIGGALSGGASVRAVSQGDDMVLSTDDGGVAWDRTTPIAGGGASFSDVAKSSTKYVAVGKRVGTADGDVGLIYTSADGISGWTERVRGPVYPGSVDASGDYTPGPATHARIDKVAFAPDGLTGWAVGSEWTSATYGTFKNILVYKSVDGGTTWAAPSRLTNVVFGSMNDIVVTDATHAYAVGPGLNVIQTVNGTAWSGAARPKIGTQTLDGFGIDATDANHKVVVGYTTGNVGGVQWTIDGSTWTTKTVGAPAVKLRSVSMITATKWIVVGDNETIGRTNDAGATWTWTTATPPKMTLTSPVTYSSASPITRIVAGTASDVGAGVAYVDVSVLRNDGKYWNPAVGWVAAPFWNRASTVNGWDTWSWNWLPEAVPGVHSYTVTARSTDAVGQSTNSVAYTITPTSGANGSISPATAQIVSGGGDKTFTITPATGYRVANVLKDGVSIGASESVTFTNVTANQTISATFAIKTYTITPTAGANGAITPGTAQTVDHGTNRTFAIEADSGYQIQDVLVNGVSQGAVATWTFTNVTAHGTISATFAVKPVGTYTITPTAGAHGAISPSTQQTVTSGADRTFTIAPDPGYHIVDVTRDGVSIGTSMTVTFTNVVSDHIIGATFAIDTHTLTYTAGAGGSIEGSATQVVDHDTDGSAVSAKPAAGYHFVKWSDDVVTNPRTDKGVKADTSLTARFAINTYTVTPTAASNGSISPSGVQTVAHGSSKTFSIAPASGYHIVNVTKDGVSIGASSSVTFSNVTANHTLAATFERTVRPVARLAGDDRYGTTAALARKGWDPTGANAWTGVKHIVIANGEPGREPDPLTAAGLAGVYDAPVLTVQVTRVPKATKTIITQIALKNPGVRIHIVGGAIVVPDARWNDIRRIPGVSPVKDRIAGRDRYETSAFVAKRIVTVKGAGAVNGVILIAGDNPAAFYDALAASPIAYARTMPMLSVRKGSIPTSVKYVLNSAALKSKPRYAASSATYIGSVAAAGAKRLTTSSNRYTAATQIANYATAPARTWTSLGDTALASKLPDALTGGAFLGRVGGVMLFTDSSSAIQTTSKTFLAGHSSAIARGWVVGGPSVLPSAQETSYRNLLNP